MRRLSALLLLCCLPMLAIADNASLGRLFLTPAERAALDVVRQNSKPPEKLVKADEAAVDEEKDTAAIAPVPPPVLPVVTVGGYVKRSDGKSTVWINGKPMQEKDTTKDVEIGRLQGNTNEVKIKLPSTGKTVNLKAGQSYDPASDRVADNLKNLPHDTIAPTVAAPPPGKASETTMQKDKGKEPQTKEGAAVDSAAKPASALPPSR
jgi:hypothetical protein